MHTHVADQHGDENSDWVNHVGQVMQQSIPPPPQHTNTHTHTHTQKLEWSSVLQEEEKERDRVGGV